MKKYLIIIGILAITILFCILGIKKENNVIDLSNLTYNDHKIKKYELSDYDNFLNDYKKNKLNNIYITSFIFDGLKYIDVKSDILNIDMTGDIYLEGEYSGGVFINTNNKKGSLNINLNNVVIDTDSKKVPGLYIYNKDSSSNFKVTITSIENTSNFIKGGSLKKSEYKDNIFANKDGFYKAGGAISSDVDINFDGPGFLNVEASNEGIESKGNINFLDGNYLIKSKEDGINTSNKDISINLKTLTILVSEEGDAIDSNGSLVIEDGIIYAMSAGDDSGLDSENTNINGGTIIALGNAYDQVSISKQKYHVFEIDSNKAILLDDDNNFIAGVDLDSTYKYLLYSDSMDRNINLYKDGTIKGNNNYGLYLNGTYER